MESKCKWTEPVLKCLLESYKTHPLLYNFELPDFNDNTKRKIAIENIKTVLLKEFPEIGLTFEEIETKLYCLKLQYNREKKNRAIPSWCFNQMDFLWGSNFDKPININSDNIDPNARCRLCLIVICDNGISIDDKIDVKNKKLIIGDLLSMVADIMIYPDDEKPQSICQSCMDLAKTAYEFKLVCEQSDEILNEERLDILKRENDSIDINNIKTEYTETVIKEESLIEETIGNNDSQLKNNEDSNSLTNNVNISVSDDENEEFGEKNAINEEEKQQKFICTICNQAFKWKQTLKTHILRHQKPEKFSCTICNKIFEWKQSLKAHMLRHENPPERKRTLKCLYCDYIPESSGKLAKHNQHEHGDMKNVICTICNKRFMKKDHLRVHMFTHNKSERQHTCEYCGKTLANAQNLKKHYVVHTGEKPYACDKCDKRFPQYASLRSHKIYVHSDKRDFVCNECGATFKLMAGLKSHLRLHKGIKPHKCTVCGIATRDLSDLKVHMKHHNGEYEYECDVCGKKFVRKSSLKTHMMTHTGEKPYVCNLCGNKFSQAHCLRSHLATQHKDQDIQENNEIE